MTDQEIDTILDQKADSCLFSIQGQISGKSESFLKVVVKQQLVEAYLLGVQDHSEDALSPGVLGVERFV